MEVAVLGGSFDPPHMGHVLLCATALAAGMDQVWWVPTSLDAFGKKPSPLDDRLSWCRAAIGPFGQRATVVPPPEGPDAVTYTVDQLEHLARRSPQDRLHFLMGADVASSIHSFHRSDELLADWDLLVVGRGDETISPSLGPRARILPLSLPPISSSDIRRLRQQGADLSGMVPQAVIPLLPNRFVP